MYKMFYYSLQLSDAFFNRLWRFRVNIVAVKTQQCTLCVLLDYMSLSNIKILIVAEQRFGENYVASNNNRYAGLHVKCPMLH
jgi:hypothetical protein